MGEVVMIPLEEVTSTTMPGNRAARPPTPPRRRGGSPSRLLETNLAEAAGGATGGILKKNRETEKSNSLLESSPRSGKERGKSLGMKVSVRKRKKSYEWKVEKSAAMRHRLPIRHRPLRPSSPGSPIHSELTFEEVHFVRSGTNKVEGRGLGDPPRTIKGS